MVALLLWPRVSTDRRRTAERELASAKAQWDAVYARWRRKASVEAYAAKTAELESAKRDLLGLGEERRRRLLKLQNEREARQRERFLDRFRTDRVSIQDIGPGRKAMLASYGIETAADIEAGKIQQISGFGDVLTSKLVAWRRSHEARFHFNPGEPIDPRELAVLERELEKRRQTLTNLLSQGPATLQRECQEIVAAELGSLRCRMRPGRRSKWRRLRLRHYNCASGTSRWTAV